MFIGLFHNNLFSSVTEKPLLGVAIFIIKYVFSMIKAQNDNSK